MADDIEEKIDDTLLKNNINENDDVENYKTEEEYRNEFLERRAEISKKTYNKGSIEIEDIYAQEYKKYDFNIICVNCFRFDRRR